MSAQNVRVLIADPNDNALVTLRALLLAKPGWHVEAVFNGSEALKRCSGEKPPDVLLSEIELGDMDCFEVCYQLHKIPREFRLVVLSSIATTEIAHDMKEYTSHFLSKPASISEIVMAIEEAAAGRGVPWR
jgi:CheY-like chemotaxis protein